jgi:hypothetical protein
VPTWQGTYRPRRSERQGRRTPPGGLSTLQAQVELLLVRHRTLARGGLQDRRPDDTRPGNGCICPEQGSLPTAHAVPCGGGELPEKPLRRPLAFARGRIIGLKKCLVPETVTVNLPGPGRRTGGNKIKVSGRLRGKSRSRGPVWGLRVLACARVLPGHAPYQGQRDCAAIHGKEKVYGSIP